MSEADITTVDAGERQVCRRATVSAPAADLFAMLADPHRHHEVDGSGSVRSNVTGPHAVQLGDSFTVGMKMFGVPYRITSKVTALEDGRLIEWQHPAGQRWRWEFLPLSETSTQVTETFDYRDSKAAKVLDLVKFPAKNANGIEATLKGLQSRFR
jgi:hypothetical protein